MHNFHHTATLRRPVRLIFYALLTTPLLEATSFRSLEVADMHTKLNHAYLVPSATGFSSRCLSDIHLVAKDLDLVDVQAFMGALPLMFVQRKRLGLGLRDSRKHAHLDNGFARKIRCHGFDWAA